MIGRIAILVLLAMTGDLRAEERVNPVREFRAGLKQLETNNFQAAAHHFAIAASNAPALKLDPAIARYNEALSHAKGGDPATAAQRFEEATRTLDLSLQQQARYNRGNALLEQSRSTELENDASKGLEYVREAMEMYDQAMQLAPDDPDPKLNYEFARRIEKQLEEKQRQQQEQQQSSGDKGEQKQPDQPSQEKQQEQQKGASKDEKESQPGEQDDKQEGKESQPEDGQQSGADERESQQGEPQPTEREEMTEDEAKVLLDSMRKAEEGNRLERQIRIGAPVPVEKDW